MQPEASNIIMIKALRLSKHLKIRKKIMGTKDRPRLSVFRSNQHISVQIIDDTSNKTLVSSSDIKETGTKSEKAYKVGKNIAEKALKIKIKKVVFDRGGFLYHGRVESLSKGAREGGLEF